MAESRPGGKPYHHGALARALLEAAEQRLAEAPDRDPSLRGLAAQLGVSATAPYAHFPTKQALMAALAARGFDRLTEALDAEPADDGAPEAQLAALARGYLEFGLAYPGLYRIMFTAGLDPAADPQLAEAGQRAFDRLKAPLTALKGSPDVAEEAALAAWALVHGLVSLKAEARAAAPSIAARDVPDLAALAARQMLGSAAP